jgi:hypothetical protein
LRCGHLERISSLISCNLPTGWKKERRKMKFETFSIQRFTSTIPFAMEIVTGKRGTGGPSGHLPRTSAE